MRVRSHTQQQMQEESSTGLEAASIDPCSAHFASSSSPPSDSIAAEIAPFSAPLHVLTHVAGVRHYLRRTAAQASAAGQSPAAWEIRPGQLLIAEREPTNPRDPHAIRLMHERWKTEEEVRGEAEAASAAAAATAASSDSAVPPAVPSTTPTLADVRPLGHIPATLARFLSPLMLRQLITIEVRVQQPQASEVAPDVASPSEAAAEDEKELNDAAESPLQPAAPSALAGLRSPSPSSVPALASPSKSQRSSADQVAIRIDILPTPMDDSKRLSLDRASRTLWTDLVVHLASLATESSRTAQARLISNFHLITSAVLDRFAHCFLGSEMEELERFKIMDDVGQGLFVRLMGRTRPARWFQIAALRYEAEEVKRGVEQLAAAGAATVTSRNEPTSAPPFISPAAAVAPPLFVRSQSTPVTSMQQQSQHDADAEDDDSDTEMKECVTPSTAIVGVAPPRPFLTRASTLSAEDWAAALPSMLHECTLSTIKELVCALGLSKMMSGQTTTATKQGLIVHLTKQRTLFGGAAAVGGGGGSSSLLHASSTRKTVLQICGDFVMLRPDFLLLAQRIHRLCFLQNDPTAPSPMMMEHLGLSRFRSSKQATVQTKPKRTGLMEGANEGVMEVAASSTSAAAVASSSSAAATAATAAGAAVPSPSAWSLFPTRACFLAYDLSVQFLLQLHEVCECVLATGEARRADQTYSADQALMLLGEALRRLQLEVVAPDSTHMLDLIALSPNSVSQHSGKPRNAAAFTSFFSRAQSSPVAPASAAASSGAASSSLSLTDLLPEVPLSSFRPLSPSHRDADRFFDAGVRGSHAFARPFRAASVYAECAHYGARVLEREKRFTQANALYCKLLSMPFDAERRGAWWNRLALNLETHLKDRRSAYAVCRLALADPSVRTGDLHELSVRTRRLWKHKDGGNARRPCPVPHVDALPDFGRVRAVKDMAQQGKADAAGTKGKKGKAGLKGTDAAAAATGDSSSSPASRVASLLDDSGYVSVLTPDGVRLTTIMANPLGAGSSGEHSIFFDASNASVRVEDLALSYYARQEFGSYVGRKDEGTVFRALFALLMFDVIFSDDVPDVFHTQYHDAPLDLGCASFYTSRAPQIEATLDSIRCCADLTALVHAAWVEHHRFRVRGLNWHSTDLSMQELGEIAECMGGPTIAFVLDTMAHDYAGWSGGLPDLCLWRPGCKPASGGAGLESSTKEKIIEVNLISSDDDEAVQDEETQDETMLSPGSASRTSAAAHSTPSTSELTSPPPPPPPALLSVSTSSPVSRSDVICISSDDDDAETAQQSFASSSGKSKSMAAASGAASSAAASTPRGGKSVKRVSSASGTASSSASAAAKSSSSKRAKHASPGTVPGQLSLTSFTAISPRFAAPSFSSPSSTKRATAPQRAASVIDMDAEFVMAVEASKRESLKVEQVIVTDALSSSSDVAASTSSASAPSGPAPSWPSFKLVEVKGPGDRCSSQQVAWIAQLAKCKSCAVELCYVVLPEQAKRWK